MGDKADIVIVGAGIAGASLAYQLAAYRSVALLEGESQPGYHSTGRSAAMLIESYGTDAVQRLTRASRTFLEQPPEGFAEAPLLTPRGYLHVARADQRDRLEAACRAAKAVVPAVRRLECDEVCALLPLIDPAYVESGLLEPHAKAIDAAALHQGYLKGVAGRGGRLITDSQATKIERAGGGWAVTTTAGRIEAAVLVNAAGAWADQVAMLAGVKPIGLVPKRRTAVLLDPPEGSDLKSWPMVTDIDDHFYVKPEGGALMVSPADETPTPPSDVQPEEMDIAIAVDRYQTLTGLEVRRIGHRWAGLRSFVRDHDPVVGFDPGEPRFFWLAGQGGFGIMTAPGTAELAKALITGQPLPDDLAKLGSDLAPIRLRTA